MPFIDSNGGGRIFATNISAGAPRGRRARTSYKKTFSTGRARGGRRYKSRRSYASRGRKKKWVPYRTWLARKRRRGTRRTYRRRY